MRSRSAPGKREGQNPLQGYVPESRSNELSLGEKEAEQLYYSLVSSTVTKKAFVILAKDLDRRCPDAGAYLTWLIYRGQKWPCVAPSEVKLFCLELYSGTGSIGRRLLETRVDRDERGH